MRWPRAVASRGVACHAVVGSNAMDEFQIRLLDLSSVIEAGTRPKLRRAGLDLAELAR